MTLAANAVVVSAPAFAVGSGWIGPAVPLRVEMVPSNLDRPVSGADAVGASPWIAQGGVTDGDWWRPRTT